MTVTMTTSGFKELEAELQRLSQSAGKAVLRRALKKAAEPLVAIIKQGTPRDTGALQESITVSTKLDKRQAGQHRRMFRDDRSAIEMFVGPSYNLGAGGRHGHLVEFGTFQQAPQPFMRPAWSQDQQNLLDRLSRDLWVEIEKTIKRAKRKAARAAGGK